MMVGQIPTFELEIVAQRELDGRASTVSTRCQHHGGMDGWDSLGLTPQPAAASAQQVEWLEYRICTQIFVTASDAPQLHTTGYSLQKVCVAMRNY